MAKGFKTGGRKKGTPNADNPTKPLMRAHTVAYLTARPQRDLWGNPRKLPQIRQTIDPETGRILKEVYEIELVDREGEPLIMSDLDFDLLAMSPADRASTQLRLAEFHTPRMKAEDLSMEIQTEAPASLIEALTALCEPGGEDEDAEGEMDG